MNKHILKAEEQIHFVKQTFESELSRQLEIVKVSSPLAVLQGTGINDDLNGTERTVRFPIKALQDKEAVVVNSLAKWKRVRLQELEVNIGEGILTDMKAIRPDEDYSTIHSIYVDQWDWEKRISKESRTIEFLKSEVLKIYHALKRTEDKLCAQYEEIEVVLPDTIKFIHSEELLQKYPSLSPKERESKITEEYGAVFLMGIGRELSNGIAHDGRAPDYDDWSTENGDGYVGLNGDILLWNPVLKESFEVSSMGVRVDKSALLNQLDIAGMLHKKDLLFHQLLLSDSIPESIGGGLGQSRICMFMLRKKHIGEVQVGIWDDKVRAMQQDQGVVLL